tara:strand:- start:8649 stop:11924 length:3276 start_codon:yes stop_codon:yes gene_type:complete
MPEIKNNFIRGKMNKDLDDRLLPNGEYRDGQNIKIAKSDDSDMGAVQNIKGNDYAYASAISDTLTLCDTIGYYKNDLTKEIFWFVTNFTGTESDESNQQTYASANLPLAQSGGATVPTICRIYYFKIGQSQPKILIDSFRLNFSKKHPILHINLIDDLLFWTDNYNQPRRINLKTALTTTFYSMTDNLGYLEDKISVAQFAPYSAPSVAMDKISSATIKSLHIENKFVKFAYRFQYRNKEYSLISPFTQTCFMPGKDKAINIGAFSSGQAGLLTSAEEGDAYKNTTVESMQNAINRVHLRIDLPDNGDIPSHASALTNGAWTGTSHNIDGKLGAGTIANGNEIVTERGDTYEISATNGSSTVTTSAAVAPTLQDNTRLYFFNNPAVYSNPLDIIRIQILYSEAGSTAIKVVENIEIDDNTFTGYNKFRAQPISNESAKLVYVYEHIYNSTKPVQTLPESEIIRVSDVIPVKAKTQESAGNRIIYGNFKQNRKINISKDNFSVTSGDQIAFNKEYLLSSVKSNREYSVGIVLQDRYGRQSTVFLPEINTAFVDQKTGQVTDGANSWTSSTLKLDFTKATGLTSDNWNADTNPLGWYSYRVVVKQPQQEYYNVYSPTLLDNINEKSWLVLHGDNINKVPRDVTDLNVETGTQGSQTRLLPRILNTTGTQAQQNTTSYLDVISIGTAIEQGLNDNYNGHGGSATEALNELYNAEKNPLLAEMKNDLGINWTGGVSVDKLTVFETEPVESVLDIYFETSTSGRIDHLNSAIADTLAADPASITLTLSNSVVNSFAESVVSGTKVADIKCFNTSGTQISSESYSIISITDGNSTNRPGAFTVDNTQTPRELKTGENFEFTNSNTDNYIIKIEVTDSSGKTLEVDKSFSVTNSNPTINVGSTVNIPQSTSSGTNIRTITATNGSAKTSANTNNLTFSIISGNTSNLFTINSSTGVLSTTSTFSSTGSHTLGIQVTDVGGATASSNLTINITSNTYTAFYRSFNGNSDFQTAGDEPTGVLNYFENTSGGASDALPEVGDTIYTNSNGTTKFTPSDDTQFFSIAGPNAAGAQQALFAFRVRGASHASPGVVYSKSLTDN